MENTELKISDLRTTPTITQSLMTTKYKDIDMFLYDNDITVYGISSEDILCITPRGELSESSLTVDELRNEDNIVVLKMSLEKQRQPTLKRIWENGKVVTNPELLKVLMRNEKTRIQNHYKRHPELLDELPEWF